MDIWPLDRNTDIKLRKMMGRSYLHAFRLEEALETYARLVRDYPNDADSILIFGNLYFVSHDLRTAEMLYQQVFQMDPANLLVQRQLDRAQRSISEAAAAYPQAERDPFDLKSVGKLLERLREEAQTPLGRSSICSAVDMLEKIAQSDEEEREAPDANTNPVDHLMPALIDLNIRQARASGQPDVADVLQSLQNNLRRQFNDRSGTGEPRDE